MLCYLNEKDRVYALSMLPLQQLGWGTSRATLYRLCLRGENRPVTLWIIGKVSTLWFYDSKEGDPHEKVTIGVAPLAKHGMAVARSMMQQLPYPHTGAYNLFCQLSGIFSDDAQVSDESWLSHISASRWQTERVTGQRKSAVRHDLNLSPRRSVDNVSC